MKRELEKEYFPIDSIFFKIDERKNRPHIPTDYFCSNHRANWFFNENISEIKDKKILDLGCFNGLHSYCCLNLGASYIHGIDLSKKQIDFAYSIFDDIPNFSGKYSFECGDILEKISHIEDNSFDTTLLIGVLYFFPDFFKLLGEIRRVTRGAVIIDTMSSAYIPLIFGEFDYKDYIKMINLPYCFYRNREDQNFGERGFEVKKFGGEQSMTYLSHNYLKMVLHNLEYLSVDFFVFDNPLVGSYKNYKKGEAFQIQDSEKLKNLFYSIKKDHNSGIFPYFLNTRYIAKVKKIGFT